MRIANFIHPPGFKEATRYNNIARLALPKKVILPLSQHTGAPSEPIVKVGDMVQTGSLIATKKAFISSNLHASISGKVTAIDDMPHPIIGRFRAIAIESDGKDIKASSESYRDATKLSGEEIMDIVKQSGIVGLGGAAFPTYVKLSPPPGKKIDTLIINGAECEPFITCDHRIMLEKSKEILRGIQLIAKVLGVKDVIIGIESNKSDAIERLGSAMFGADPKGLTIKVATLKTRYPQGGEKQLISTLLDREVPSGGLPLDIGCVVSNIHTVFSIYEAVYFSKALYERVVTVSGRFLRDPRNLLVRIGTPIRDLLEHCKLIPKSSVHKIVMGGPMTGVAQYDLDAPILKGTSGILVLDKRFKGGEELSCIRCSSCIEACPAGLMPCMIGVSAKKNKFEIAATYSPLDCMECGACSYVCPSKIPLVQYIKLAKTKVKR